LQVSTAYSSSWL